MKNTRSVAIVLVSALGLILFILVTDPYKLPLTLLVVPFLLLGMGLFSACKLLLSKTPLSRVKQRFIAGTVTTIVLMLTLLQSIRQLSIRDFLILFALLVGLAFYMRRIDI